MVAYSFVQRLTPNLALAGAGLAGALVALATLAIPAGLLEDIVVTSGIAAFVPAAEPPLGATARICVGVFAGGAVALIAWLLLSALLAWRDSRREPESGERRPAVRRADAHPDAPPRPPLLATRDLGMPFAAKVEQADSKPEEVDADARVFALSEGKEQQVEAEVRSLHLPELPPEPVIAMGTPTPPVESIPGVYVPEQEAETIKMVPTIAAPPTPQPLPADLDQPLSAFDPDAILERPLVPPPPLPPLVRAPVPRVFDAGERFETFELTPQTRPAPVPDAPHADNLAAPETDASVHALLDRLERGIVRRVHRPEPEVRHEPAPAPQPEAEPEMQGLEGALEALRKLAVRA
jgi:hypothetical protein